MSLNKLDFPPSPVNGQIYTQNGLSYQYDGTYGVWLTTIVSPIPTPTMANTQIMFVDGPYPNGSYGLTFSKGANTTYANTVLVSNSVVITSNVTAAYHIGDGSALTNLTVAIAANNYAGYMANSVNSYWTSTGFFANTSGSSYNGNLNVPRGNLSLGITNASARLYVQGSAASAINTMPDVATIVPNFGANNNFAVTLAGNRFVDNPYNPTAGQSGVISIVQDTTGGRTLSWGNTWKFQGNVAPTLSTSANAVDLLVYYVRTTSNISVQLINNIG